MSTEKKPTTKTAARARAAALILFLCAVPYARSAEVRHEHVIRHVAVSRTSLNLSSGETATLDVSLSRSARITIDVVDRDGFVVRTVSSTNAAAGVNTFSWDGRNERGAPVPNEAYSFRVVADGGADEYFPAARPSRMVAVDPLSYARTTATLSYRLSTPARVHVQAGTVTGGAEGPVLKTIVDRQPRDAGTIAEHWSGFDESGSLYVPDLPGFAIAIAATPLPENSVITYGNAKQAFLEYAAHRTGQSLFRHQAHGAHHMGLDVFNDLAPHLTLTPLDGARRADARSWSIAAPELRLQVHADGPTAGPFLRQPGKMFLFVDAKLIATRDATKSADPFTLPLSGDGEHIVVVNWRSDYGPVAVAVLRVRRDGDQAAEWGSRR